ncbi:hypothetical protein M409DRAFT_18878 [Zasmidium cellare ATCC 36951]|uniref:Uncharacterized protein n=1 Tax=Zasmidium cellare ATCC 36951 TaxID=1080233 RepID=A0A6A6CV34_ZASCE|nr:uncharacterized protein M409DRAFT_18878 [Zasmidium cellare ATCC 36951]KAF2170905.1 hypothetical protein M409DRAFT_18878 [Zasmidium cellare ATCC 36951]
MSERMKRSLPLYGLAARFEYLKYSIKIIEVVARLRLLEAEDSDFEHFRKGVRKELSTTAVEETYYRAHVDHENSEIQKIRGDLSSTYQNIMEMGDNYAVHFPAHRMIPRPSSAEASCHVPVLAPEIRDLIWKDMASSHISPLDREDYGLPSSHVLRGPASRELAAPSLVHRLNRPRDKLYVCGLQNDLFARDVLKFKSRDVETAENALGDHGVWKMEDSEVDSLTQTVGKWLQLSPDSQPLLQQRCKQKAEQLVDNLRAGLDELQTMTYNEGRDDSTEEHAIANIGSQRQPMLMMQDLAFALHRCIDEKVPKAYRRRALPAPTESEAGSSTRSGAMAAPARQSHTSLSRRADTQHSRQGNPDSAMISPRNSKSTQGSRNTTNSERRAGR